MGIRARLAAVDRFCGNSIASGPAAVSSVVVEESKYLCAEPAAYIGPIV